MLEEKHAHPRDSRIRFYSDDHVYEVDGKRFVSVTSVIKQCFPQFNADEAIKKMGSGHPLYGKPPEEIKALWEANGKASREAGTRMHQEIEDFLNKGEIGETDEFKRFHSIFTQARKGKPYRTEWMIFDEETAIAGTIDYIYTVGDAFAMTDWKRSKKIKKKNPWQRAFEPVNHLPACNFSEYCLQQNIYGLILLKHYGITVEKMALARFYGNDFHSHIVPIMEDEARRVMALAAEIQPSDPPCGDV